jgi:hypothetical protein
LGLRVRVKEICDSYVAVVIAAKKYAAQKSVRLEAFFASWCSIRRLFSLLPHFAAAVRDALTKQTVTLWSMHCTIDLKARLISKR